MLCLPGLTPVWNVDHATGEIGGTVEPERLEAALVAQRGEVGELALLEHLLGQAVVHPVEAEDHDSLDPAPRHGAASPNRVRDSRRTGQVSTVRSAEKIAAKTAKNDPASANPAPGPM